MKEIIEQDPPLKPLPKRGFMGSVPFGGVSSVNPQDYKINRNEGFFHKVGQSLGIEGNKPKVYDHPYLDQWNQQEATWAHTLGKGVANLFPSIGATFAESMAYLPELVEKAIDGHTDYSNPVVEKALQFKKDYTYQIYKENPDKLMDMADFGWWVDGASNLVSSVASFGAVGASIGLGARLGASAAIRFGANATLAKASAQVLTSAALAYTEGAMAGNEVYKSTYNHQYEEGLKLGLNEDQAKARAKTIAGNSADATVGSNTAINTLLNITSVAPMFRKMDIDDFYRSGAGARKVGESLSDWKTRVSTLSEADDAVKSAYKLAPGMGKSLKHYGIEAAQEAGEELVNEYATQTGLELGRRGDKDTSLQDGLSELSNFFKRTMTAEGALSAFWGAIGGAGNTFVMESIPIHHSYRRDSKNELIPIIDEEGNPTDKYQVGRFSSRFIEKNQNLELFKSSKDAVLADIEFVESKTQAMKDAYAKGDVDVAETARRELISAHMLNAVFRGEAKNFENALDDWTKLDNSKDLSEDYTKQAQELEVLLEEARVSQDFKTMKDLQSQLDVTNENIQKYRGKTEAMMSGVTDSMDDNSYLEEVTNFKKDIQLYDKMFTSVRNSLAGLADPDIEMEAARRIMLGHIEANLLQRDIKNLNKSVEELEANLVDPFATLDDLTNFNNRAFNAYIHDSKSLEEYSRAMRQVEAGNKEALDFWSKVFNTESNDSKSLLRALNEMIDSKEESIEEFKKDAESRMGPEVSFQSYMEEAFKNASENESLIKLMRAREDRQVRLTALEWGLTGRNSPKKVIAEVKKSITKAKKSLDEEMKFLQAMSRKKLMDQVEHIGNFVNRSEFVIEMVSQEIQAIEAQLENAVHPDEVQMLQNRLKAKQFVVRSFRDNLIQDRRTLVDLINDMSAAEADSMYSRFFENIRQLKRRAKQLFKKRSRSIIPVGEDSEILLGIDQSFSKPGMSQEQNERFAELLKSIDDASIDKLAPNFDLDSIVLRYSVIQAIVDAKAKEINIDLSNIPANYREEVYYRLVNKIVGALSTDLRHQEMYPVLQKFNSEFVENLSDNDYNVMKSAFPTHEVLGTLPDFNTIQDLKQEAKNGTINPDLVSRLELLYNELQSINKKYDEALEPEVEEEVESQIEEEDINDADDDSDDNDDSESDDGDDGSGDDGGSPSGGGQLSAFEVESFLGSLLEDTDVSALTTKEEANNALKTLESKRKTIQPKTRSTDEAIRERAEQDLELIKEVKKSIRNIIDSLPDSNDVLKPDDRIDYAEASYNTSGKVSSGNTIAQMHMKYTEELDENGQLSLNQTGYLNDDSNLEVLLPGVLETGATVYAEVIPRYQGKAYTEYDKEYQAEEVDIDYSDGDIIPDENIGSVTIRLLDSKTNKPVGFVHDHRWITSKVGGNGFRSVYRNVNVKENYDVGTEDYNRLKSIEDIESELMTMRSEIIKSYNEDPRKKLIFSVMEKGKGALIENNEEGLSTLELFPDPDLRIDIASDSNVSNSSLAIHIPSATRDVYIPVIPINNRVSGQDANTIFNVIRDYALLHSEGVSNTETSESRMKLESASSLVGFDLTTSLGVKKFINQFYFDTVPFSKESLDSATSGFYLDVIEVVGELQDKGQMYLGVPGKTSVPVELFDSKGELNTDFINVLEESLLLRRYDSSFSNSKLSIKGIGDKGSLQSIKYDEESGEYLADKVFENYNQMVLSRSTVPFDGRNKVNGKYVYTVNPVIRLTMNSTSSLQENTDSEEQSIGTSLNNEVETVETFDEENYDGFLIDQDESVWGANSTRIDPVNVRRTLQQISDVTEDHNGLSVDEAYIKLVQEGLFEVPYGYNPFRLCKL